MSHSYTQGRRIAVIDIGTNTLLLLVAEVRTGPKGVELIPIYEACEFGRLGQGLDRSGELSAEAVSRSLEIVRSYRAVMDNLQVDDIRAIGTQALREARNADEFVTPAVELLGAPITVIAGEREARLISRAVEHSLPVIHGDRFVIADVGGGSTEIIISSPDGTSVESFTSLPIGSVRLHERHLHSDPPSAEQIHALMTDIDNTLNTITLPRHVLLVGSAGTATTLSSVDQRLPAYDASRVHGYEMPRHTVERLLEELLAQTVAQRRERPGMPQQRADVIAAGAAIFIRLLHRLESETFVVNDRGVMWGVAHELASL